MFDLSGITSNHLVYIPLVLLLGLVIGYNLGARTVRVEYERRRQRLKE